VHLSRIIFCLATFVGSVLLFLVQPMAAKMLLPIFGGSPAVWTAAMLFFQVALLGGYAYAHFSNTKLNPARQRWLHVILLVAAFFTLPITSGGGAFDTARRLAPTASQPAFLVFGLLAATVGLSYFIVSSSSPTLQRWFSTTNDPSAQNPYFLYAISNVGSMLGLFAYPFILEPRFNLSEQANIWRWGFLLLIGLVLASSLFVRSVTPEVVVGTNQATPWSQRLRWILTAAIPSSLLLGATSYISGNIAPIPLIWVVPLAVYLITFILAFASKPLLKSAQLARILPLLVVPLAFTQCIEATEPLVLIAVFHIIVLFVACWMCHAMLSETRPEASKLTEFYLWLSVGGAVGGMFNSLIAPIIFKTYAEYPLALVLACFLRPNILRKRQTNDLIWGAGLVVFVFAVMVLTKNSGMPADKLRAGIAIGIPLIVVFALLDRARVYAVGLGAVFLAANVLTIASPGKLLTVRRSFFGVHRVVQSEGYTALLHGNTIHGRQSLDPAKKRLPLTYYHPTGPIGRIFGSPQLMQNVKNIGLVGLGVGSLASYGRPDQTLTYFEIDPEVLELARDSGYFSFLKEARCKMKYVLGDARLTLANQPDGSFDMLVLDAFSSDAIPTHLLTKEAIELYKRKLSPYGFIVFHISNRYLELAPILATTAKQANLFTFSNMDDGTAEEKSDGKTQSHWALLLRDSAQLQLIAGSEIRGKAVMGGIDWNQVDIEPGTKAWTDEYMNVLGAFKPED
jgi:hypothetical protein